ncbi:MAG: COR domain-containing protein [Bacteroidota bacterium]
MLLKDRFEVCYRLNDQDDFLVPILLSNNRLTPEISEEPDYIVRFAFPFMPFGFFSRMIVRLYSYIWDEYVWLTGVWLRHNGCKALLLDYKDSHSGSRLIEVRLYGDKNSRIKLLGIVRHEMDHIQQNLFSNMEFIEHIPCPCGACKELDIPYYHQRNDLENLLSRQNMTSQCKESGESIPITQLLQAIIDQDTIEKYMKDRIGKPGKENIDIRIDNHLENIGNPVQKVEQKVEQTQTTSIQIEIKNTIDKISAIQESIKGEKKLLNEKGLSDGQIEAVSNELELTKSALEQAKESPDSIPDSTKDRFEDFVEELEDEDSLLRKTLKILRKGTKYGVRLARTYNKVAENLALPIVPPIVLDSLEGIVE